MSSHLYSLYTMKLYGRRETLYNFQKKMERGLYANTIFFTLVILMSQHGFSHARNDQSTRLKVLRDAKVMNRGDQTFKVDQGEFEWKEKFKMNLNMNEHDDEVGNMEDDLIKGGLPGQPSSVEFSQFSGYVTVDKLNGGRSLFYYFVEAVQDSSSKPLVLWLNGGPGCSSLGMGAMIEIGPFGARPDGETLYRRQFSWNNAANVLFLESPAGVGFSYSNNTDDYNTTGDRRTAIDAYTFLLNWFERFPHYKTRDVFITGESYAGFYIPELADIILKENVINLKGIMIGNGIMNDETDKKGMYEYLWTHALISDETFEGLEKNCILENDKCEQFEEKVGEEAGDIDFYNIYGPTCRPGTSSKSPRRFQRKIQAYDPCETIYVHKYLNLPHVQEAIHANITTLPYQWKLCSYVLGDWTDSPASMFPIYKRLIPSGLLIHLYSGDTDAVVPVTSTRYSINPLNLTIIKPWHYWLDETNEVGGYRVIYDGVTFTTVRGAGHEVPKHTPGRALVMLSYFLSHI